LRVEVSSPAWACVCARERERKREGGRERELWVRG
jgi:hypothetical protein